MEVVRHHFASSFTNPSSNPLRRTSENRTKVTLIGLPSLFSPTSRRSSRPHSHRAELTLVRGALVGEEEEVKQAKEMAAARKRWESLRWWWRQRYNYTRKLNSTHVECKVGEGVPCSIQTLEWG
ncbi:hypothetical protein KSP39_PZI019318 [Platanthera zijinensis]|uniref:Uncharacterized protein n=1 Tax=Platanthera zijinensis TaxID=2320716 RepID=A0AAP0B1L0_9ASPA